jgi:hypothetical protein
VTNILLLLAQVLYFGLDARSNALVQRSLTVWRNLCRGCGVREVIYKVVGELTINQLLIVTSKKSAKPEWESHEKTLVLEMESSIGALP